MSRLLLFPLWCLFHCAAFLFLSSQQPAPLHDSLSGASLGPPHPTTCGDVDADGRLVLVVEGTGEAARLWCLPPRADFSFIA